MKNTWKDCAKNIGIDRRQTLFRLKEHYLYHYQRDRSGVMGKITFAPRGNFWPGFMLFRRTN